MARQVFGCCGGWIAYYDYNPVTMAITGIGVMANGQVDERYGWVRLRQVQGETTTELLLNLRQAGAKEMSLTGRGVRVKPVVEAAETDVTKFRPLGRVQVEWLADYRVP